MSDETNFNYGAADTPEFYDAMKHFERCVCKKYVNGFRSNKEGKNAPRGCWYQHGETNDAFRIFLEGVAYGRMTPQTNRKAG